ncbi:metalloregulator ArsR/SmtB family transcription factor [Fictibacillus sp. WQ 8-8]|uniref:Metalloregulator ArsR/SmtB family transcription factor n=1 Tax=Fictibacillus marinisediminis TaxID=2878389 RepID=A0A9X2BD76_9BACL|nr:MULTISPECIES: metalloregulator ArsR/SmtB family transcription factor [Fictibacillus]MCK6256375.1 metalloregulator ArsR/SmtB family transcription factor [Fictibacillus marinisediminis]MCQ6265163.1 metalloregulator ArsR/SmtB family transcription factor [Fictibacillus sp. WQ 8-8]MED2971847.1 metalloregulator ArsR/SmtB family transcription factor [Fictibacillus sp. B-59209]
MQLIEIDTKVKFLRGFADKTRIQILEALMDEEKTVSQIVEAINGNQSNISQHLACLKGCGIIVGRQEGRYCYYRIRNQQVRELLNMFNVVLADVQNDVACCDSHID